MLIVKFKNMRINKEQTDKIAKEIKRQIDDNGILLIDDSVEIMTTNGSFDDIKVVNANVVEEKQPLLNIKIQDEESAPIIHVEGKRLTKLTNVKLEWETAKWPDGHDLHYEIERLLGCDGKEKIGMVVGYNE